jgi:rhodanese-related sulfurtransferase
MQRFFSQTAFQSLHGGYFQVARICRAFEENRPFLLRYCSNHAKNPELFFYCFSIERGTIFVEIYFDMTIIDVRSPAEFASGHVMGSINIPLQEVPDRIEEIRSIAQPLILCCASGNRSGQATNFLHSQGFECENGGSWLAVQARFNS